MRSCSVLNVQHSPAFVKEPAHPDFVLDAVRAAEYTLPNPEEKEFPAVMKTMYANMMMTEAVGGGYYFAYLHSRRREGQTR